MIKVIPFGYDHPDIIGSKLFDESNIRSVAIEDDGSELLYAYSVVVEDEIICSFGAVKIWNGCFELFGFFGDKTTKHIKSIYKIIKSNFRDFMLSVAPWRVTINIHKDNIKGHAIAHKLGFKLESFAKGYFPDGNGAHVYVIYTPDNLPGGLGCQKLH